MHGFASGIFSYILTIQKSSVLSEDYITKLIRVCQSDKNFYSYLETPLRCEYEGKKMDFLQAAYTGKPGQLLAKSLGVYPEDDLLFGIFGSKFQENRLTTRDEESALCVYTLRSIDLVLKRNIQNCFQGIGIGTGPDHIRPPFNCLKTVSSYFHVQLDTFLLIWRQCNLERVLTIAVQRHYHQQCKTSLQCILLSFKDFLSKSAYFPSYKRTVNYFS